MKTTIDDNVKLAHDYLLELGKFTVNFAKIKRAPRYPSGKRENDLEHSFHLAISAIELAVDFYPELDAGLVAQFSLVHDLPETYAGDTWAFDISDEDRAIKEKNEAKATKRLLNELPPHTADLLNRYEKQIEPEARFVRLVDKLTPAIINMVDGDANTFKQDFGIDSYEKLRKNHTDRTARFQKMFPEFDFVHTLHELVSKTHDDYMFKDKR